jgi:hypothetical protein
LIQPTRLGGELCLAPVLECPPSVISGHWDAPALGPLYPQKRTLTGASMRSANANRRLCTAASFEKLRARSSHECIPDRGGAFIIRSISGPPVVEYGCCRKFLPLSRFMGPKPQNPKNKRPARRLFAKNSTNEIRPSVLSPILLRNPIPPNHGPAPAALREGINRCLC